MMNRRKSEADKSLVVQVHSENSYQELFNYCSQFGIIKNAFHYKIPTDPNNNFIILEFDDVSQYNSALEHSCFIEEGSPVPVVSPFLWFKAVNSRKATAKINATIEPPKLTSMDAKLTDESLTSSLQEAETIDDQIKILYKSTNLCDLGTRMRFIAAKQLETAMQGLFPKVRAFPFGSTVNGFGKVGCDLDLILRFHPDRLEVPDSRLIFHSKTGSLNERAQSQKQIEILGDILHLFLPGTINIRRIIHARVPIIKYNHEYLNLDVDLSMSNLTGLYMSELLYIYGEMDERVRPLTFCIRKWASSTKLTNSIAPGRWITNFSLTLLVLFFLQCLRKPVVPSLNHLIALATKDDVRITENHINCTFVRDLRKTNFQTNNTDSLSELLIQFYEFYAQFDFSSKSISLIEGKPTSKMDHSALWIINPFEQMTNVSKNVSLEELERFKFESKNAAWILESTEDKSTEEQFTLLNLFKSNRTKIVKPEMFFKSRLVDVSQIFGDPDKESDEKSSPDIIFRNNNSRNEVNSIRQATKKQIIKSSSKRLLKTR